MSRRHIPVPLADRLEAQPRLYLAIFTGWFFIGNVFMDMRRPFWFDELYTLALGHAPSLGSIWPLLRAGNEPNPPLTFWVQWLIFHTLGEGEVVSRLPATVGFWVMCLCLFQFVRRRAGVLYGFVALLFPVFTYTATYGTYARGYGWLLGSAAVSLLCWQYASDPGDASSRRWALPLMALATAVLVSSHYYALYVTGAIAVGEGIRSVQRKAVDVKIWIALALGVTPLIAYIPLIQSAMRGAAGFWVLPEIGFIAETYEGLFGAILVFFLLWLWLAVTDDGPRAEVKQARLNWPMHEAVACLLLVAMPLLIGIAAQLLPLMFYKMYVQPVVIGTAILVALFAQRLGAGSDRARRAVVVLLVWFGFVPWGIFYVLRAAAWPAPATMVMNQFKTLTASPLPLVVDNLDRSLALQHYAPPELRQRLFVLDDRAASMRYVGSNGALGAMGVVSTLQDVHFTRYGDFIRDHSEFALALPNPESWIVQKLLADGWKLELATYEKGFGPFAEEMFIFHAHAPKDGLTVSNRQTGQLDK